MKHLNELVHVVFEQWDILTSCTVNAGDIQFIDNVQSPTGFLRPLGATTIPFLAKFSFTTSLFCFGVQSAWFVSDRRLGVSSRRSSIARTSFVKRGGIGEDIQFFWRAIPTSLSTVLLVGRIGGMPRRRAHSGGRGTILSSRNRVS